MGEIRKYKKKPIVIESIQLTDSNLETISNWLESHNISTTIWSQDGLDSGIVIPTLEGDMRASIGDWIIKGVKGEFYPCKPDIFEKTYEVVGDFDGDWTESPAPDHEDEIKLLEEQNEKLWMIRRYLEDELVIKKDDVQKIKIENEALKEQMISLKDITEKQFEAILTIRTAAKMLKFF